jgi:DNA-directed RNA polymerase subunit RPC12/RpoP
VSGPPQPRSFRTACPYCHRRMELPEILRETTVRCGCGHYFDADPLREPPPSPILPRAPLPPRRAPAAPPPPPPPLLTTAHQCDQCKGDIDQATGAWASSRVCPHENCGRVTSLYAVLYRCPACGQPLETPRRVDDQATAGTETVCPKCAQRVRVPFGALQRDDGRVGTPDEFGFRCVHCSLGIRAHRSQARQLWTCPHCHKPVEVPPGGRGLGTVAPSTGHPREVLPEVTVHCPRCRQKIPKTAASCPFCGDTPR